LVGELVLQVEVFLTLVMDFDAHTGDASYTVGVVSLLLNCIQLSCRSEFGAVSLKHNFQPVCGYFYCEQLALRIVESSAEPKGQCELFLPSLFSGLLQYYLQLC